jgi:hypothetical protein
MKQRILKSPEEKQKPGPKPKQEGDKVKGLTVYRPLKEIIEKGGSVRLKKLIHGFLDRLK